jgi:hypothetical protein
VLQLREVLEPDLDEGTDCLLEPGGPGRLERCLVALAHLVERDALLEPVVPGHEEVLDLRAGILRSGH